MPEQRAPGLKGMWDSLRHNGVSSLQTTRFPSKKGNNEAREHVNAQWRMHSSFLFPDLSQLLRRAGGPPVTQAGRQPKKSAPEKSYRPTTKINSFPLPKTHTKATQSDVWDLTWAEKEGGKSDRRV